MIEEQKKDNDKSISSKSSSSNNKEEMEEMLEINKNIGTKKLKLIKKLGAGAFGEIYHAINLKNSFHVAVKLEPSKTKHPQLFYETYIYKYLLGDNAIFDKGIPLVYYCSEMGDYNVMIMELLGESLESLFNMMGRKFSLKTITMIGLQMLTRIEFVHNHKYIHRDIKPDNFLIGSGRCQNRLLLIDFGLAKRYIGKDGKHIPYKDNKNLTGTARYASLNTHLGIEQARRDDLESMCFTIFYFLNGCLPWQNMKAKNKTEKYQKILEKKINYTPELLCKGFPIEFAEIMKYCRSVPFEEKPDYEYIRKQLKQVMDKNQFVIDNKYDWMNLIEQKRLLQQQKQEQLEGQNVIDTTQNGTINSLINTSSLSPNFNNNNNVINTNNDCIIKNNKIVDNT